MNSWNITWTIFSKIVHILLIVACFVTEPPMSNNKNLSKIPLNSEGFIQLCIRPTIKPTFLLGQKEFDSGCFVFYGLGFGLVATLIYVCMLKREYMPQQDIIHPRREGVQKNPTFYVMFVNRLTPTDHSSRFCGHVGQK